MFYQEKVINGVLSYRSDPDGNWTPFTQEELTNTIEALTEELGKLSFRLLRIERLANRP